MIATPTHEVRKSLKHLPLVLVNSILGYCHSNDFVEKIKEVNYEFSRKLANSPLALYTEDFMDHVVKEGVFVHCHHAFLNFPVTTKDLVYFISTEVPWDLTNYDNLEMYYELWLLHLAATQHN
jgi:hypothetical protein